MVWSSLDCQEEMQLRMVQIHSMGKIMEEYVGTASDFRGFFKIYEASAVDDNLHRSFCDTAKGNPEKSGTETNLFGVMYMQMNIFATGSIELMKDGEK